MLKIKPPTTTTKKASTSIREDHIGNKVQTTSSPSMLLFEED